VSGVVLVFKAGQFHTASHGMADGTFVHGPVGDITFEEKLFCSVVAIVCSQVIEDEAGKNSEAIFVSFALHNFDLHSFAVDVGNLEQAQLIEAQAGTVEKSDHASVLDVFNGSEQVSGLLLRKHSRKLVFLTGIDFRREHVRFSQHMLKEEAEALRCHATLVAAQIKGALQVVDIENDLIVADGKRMQIIEVGEEKPYFRSVVAHRSCGIPTCCERGRKFSE